MTRYCWRCATPLPEPPPTTCRHCGEIHYVNPKPCGDAIVIREGRLLMLRRAVDPDAGAWDVPGGFCEADEHPMAAAERELLEELGVRGRATAYVGTWMDRYGEPAADGFVIHTAVSAYLVALEDVDAPPLPAPAEATDWGWFALDALPEPIAFARHALPMLHAARELIASGGNPGPLPDRTW